MNNEVLDDMKCDATISFSDQEMNKKYSELLQQDGAYFFHSFDSDDSSPYMITGVAIEKGEESKVLTAHKFSGIYPTATRSGNEIKEKKSSIILPGHEVQEFRVQKYESPKIDEKAREFIANFNNMPQFSNRALCALGFDEHTAPESVQSQSSFDRRFEITTHSIQKSAVQEMLDNWIKGIEED